MSHQFCTQCGTPLEPNARFCTACGTAVSSQDQSHSKRSKKTKQRSSFPWLPVLLIVGSTMIVIAVGYSLIPDSSPAIVDVPDEHDASGLPYPDVPRISVAETKERLDNGTAVVVDVRSSEDYAKSHIIDAFSLPLNELQSRYQELASDTEIITYCT
ncbi:MAG: zinc-ribbon domain-containing protein [Ardenticatenaceae bacterium]|nr:zinc-ribbon domain-containing protein [Ardenticatenaceae bacterium]